MGLRSRRRRPTLIEIAQEVREEMSHILEVEVDGLVRATLGVVVGSSGNTNSRFLRRDDSDASGWGFFGLTRFFGVLFVNILNLINVVM